MPYGFCVPIRTLRCLPPGGHEMRHEDEDIKRLLTEAVPRLTPPMDRVGAVAARVRRRRQRLIGSSALAVAMVVALGVGGVQMSTGNHAPPLRTAGGSGGEGRWTSCAEAAPGMARLGFMTPEDDAAALPRLDGDFAPTGVVICEREPQRRADGGEDLVLTERRGDDVAALVIALRLPDESSTARSCTLEMPMLPWLAVVDADGRWMRPRIPVGACGKLRPEVREALAALELTTVATRPVAEIESAEAAAAGCSQSWKDVVSVETTRKPGPRTGALPEPFPARQQVRLCVYEVSKSETGNFVHGTVLEADRRTAIEKVLKAAGPAEPCSAHASRFALLRSVTGGDPQTYVELDGCRRIMVVTYPGAGGPVIAQGDDALAKLIDKP
ncbi:hypothetical protein V6U77_08955 [Micromonospora sp. CPCC 205546]|uniref:hypothetical protein n=1 Tax=Micromonospora sp. CPCC 205546 TaxID=3122397 RepID=UPI002FF42C23